MKKIIAIALVLVMLLALAIPAFAADESKDLFMTAGYYNTADDKIFNEYVADIQMMGYDKFNRSTNAGYPLVNGWMVLRGWMLTDGGVKGYAYTVDTPQESITSLSQLTHITTDYLCQFNAVVSFVNPGMSQESYNKSGFSLCIYVGNLEPGKTHSVKLYGITNEDRLGLVRDIQVSVPEFGYRLAERDIIEQTYVLDVGPETFGGQPRTQEWGLFNKKAFYAASRTRYDKLTGLFVVDDYQTKLTTIPHNDYTYGEVTYAFVSSTTTLEQLQARVMLRDYDPSKVAWSTDILTTPPNNTATSPAWNWGARVATAELKKEPNASKVTADTYFSVDVTHDPTTWDINTSADMDKKVGGPVVIILDAKLYTDKQAYDAALAALDAAAAEASAKAAEIRQLLGSQTTTVDGFNKQMLIASLSSQLDTYLGDDISITDISENDDGTYDVTLKHLESTTVIDGISLNMANDPVILGGKDITDKITDVANASITVSKDENAKNSIKAEIDKLIGDNSITVTLENYSESGNTATFNVVLSSGDDSFTLDDMSAKLKPVFVPPSDENNTPTEDANNEGGGEETTDTGAADTAPTTEETEEKSGCGSTLGITPIAVAAMVGALGVTVNKKKRHCP